MINQCIGGHTCMCLNVFVHSKIRLKWTTTRLEFWNTPSLYIYIYIVTKLLSNIDTDKLKDQNVDTFIILLLSLRDKEPTHIHFDFDFLHMARLGCVCVPDCLQVCLMYHERQLTHICRGKCVYIKLTIWWTVAVWFIPFSVFRYKLKKHVCPGLQ